MLFLKYVFLFIIIFLSLIFIWKLTEWIPRFIIYIKMNPQLLDKNRKYENYAIFSSNLTKKIVDVLPSYKTNKERGKGGVKVILVGISLIILSIIITFLYRQ